MATKPARTVSISMCKDEVDIVEDCLRRMAVHVDRLVVADNGSTDGTRELLHELANDLPLTVLDDPEVGYWQSRKMSALARQAVAFGAEWVIPHDMDEVWYSPFGRLGDVLAEQDGNAIATADLYDHVPSAVDADGSPVERIGWRRREKAPLPKAACRPRPSVTIHQGNHGADYGGTINGLLVVRHYPYRSVEQMISKARNGAAAYAATDLPEHVGQHWRDYGRLSNEQIGEAFRKYFWSASPETDPTLIFDPCPSA